MRTFSDPTGQAWRVWAVAPAVSPARQREDRRQDPAPDPVIERRRSADRRRGDPAGLPGVAPALTTGWLAFETEDPPGRLVRRRLAPIPPDWAECPEAQLRRYLGQAAGGEARARSA